jgi:hypothetical protein
MARVPYALVLSLGAVLAGCGNTCDDLVATLADCVGDVGASETEETTNQRTDDVCDSEEETCAACVLSSKLNLCTEYGEALDGCRAAGECPP